MGDPAEHLAADTAMVEIVNLARDLEYMREQLVGTSARLRAEMVQRESEQAQRAILEAHLRHEQRLATVGTFAGGLAHEFNNILLPMMLFSEQALEDIPCRSSGAGRCGKHFGCRASAPAMWFPRCSRSAAHTNCDSRSR